MVKGFALSAVFFVSFLFSNPNDPQIVRGDVSIQAGPNGLEVTAGAQSVIHWKDFSIANGETTRFIQPSDQAAVLNKVVGGEISQILGRLEANGKVFLINPNGVIIGPEGVIQTASFIASTLDLAIEDFLRGDALLFKGDSDAQLINLGKISTPQGFVALFARKIDQKGEIEAGLGSYLATSREIFVRMDGKKGIIVVPSQNEGQICLEGQLRSNPYALAMRTEESGDVECIEADGRYFIAPKSTVSVQTGQFIMEKGSEIEAGDVLIKLGEGISELQGNIKSPNGKVHIDGLKSTLFHTGQIDASGDRGGGIQISVDHYTEGGSIKAQGALGDGGTMAVRAERGFIQVLSGTIDVAGQQGGSIEILTKEGRLFSSGSLLAIGQERGGKIHLSGKDVALVGSNIDASGMVSGGEIWIGGALHGKGPMFNAEKVNLNFSTVVQANGTESRGGTIIVFAEENTSSQARLSALGGFIEISGKKSLANGSEIELGRGQLLIDPHNIVLDSGTGVYPQFLVVDPDPSGGGYNNLFKVLSGGNFIVANDNRTIGGQASAGAVYLYNGTSYALISALTGSNSGDHIGYGITLLTDGNFVTFSPDWNSNRGAVTWVNGLTGLTATVSASNSLVGNSTGDYVSVSGVTALLSGGYFVGSSSWNGGRGAATWGNGALTGTVGSSNSLFGSSAGDNIGNGVTVLNNGNYVTYSDAWNSNRGAATWVNGSNGHPFGTSSPLATVSSSNSLVGTSMNDVVSLAGITQVGTTDYVINSYGWSGGLGAVTWGSGTGGIAGTVSSYNSLVGNNLDDSIGSGGITVLSNGNYVVQSTGWSSVKGATTWGSGTSGVSGIVSSSNSLVGDTNGDEVGSNGITILSNNNYVVRSPSWHSGAGAATWVNGSNGHLSGSASPGGVVSSSNSLVGTIFSDGVANVGILSLGNNNYVVISPNWSNGGTSNVGAVTWGNGTSGTVGAVSSSNSLIGGTVNDQIGFAGRVTVLANSNYVVRSSAWQIPISVINTGAVTCCSGTGVTSAVVTGSNSLIGDELNDSIGSGGIFLVGTQNYVVCSYNWHSNLGAATWRDGTVVLTGAVVSGSNSLTGSGEDSVGGSGATTLSNGNYVVLSPNWNNSFGAATWANGNNGHLFNSASVSGVVGSSNSVIGDSPSDQIGREVDALTGNGNYVIVSTAWHSQTGAVTWGNGGTGTVGVVGSGNSLLGSNAGDKVGSGGITALSNGNYVVLSPLWDSYFGAITFGNGASGVSGVLSSSNSIVGTDSSQQIGNSGLHVLNANAVVVISLSDTINTWVSATTSFPGTISNANSIFGSGSWNSFQNVVKDTTTGSYFLWYDSQIVAGLIDPTTISYTAGPSFDMTIYPAALTELINSGATVTLQANNDATISTALVINSGGAGNLILSSGRSLTINANVTAGTNSLTFLANAPLSDGVVDAERDAGSAVVTLGNGVAISTTSGNISLTLSTGTGKTHSNSGNVTFGSGSSVESTSGNILIDCANSLVASGSTTVSSTNGNITLVVDELYPTSPSYGTGAYDIPDATLTTSGLLQIYSSQASLDTLPSTINGTPYTAGEHTTNGVYYPDGTGGTPFAIFYKTGGTPPSPTPSPVTIVFSSSQVAAFLVGNSQALYQWQFPLFFPLFSLPKPTLLGGTNDPTQFWIYQVGNEEIYH